MDSTSDQIIVTAAKRAQASQDLDAAVAVADKDDFARRGFQGVEQIDRLLADITLRARSSQAYTNVTMRGQASLDYYNPAAQLYVDGLPQDQALFFRQVPIDLDRVEVLYGPQGTLYGRGALGGVINVVTRRPDDQLRGQVEGNVSSLGSGGQALVNLPLVKDALYADVSVGARHQKGQMTDMVTGQRVGDTNSENIRARLRYAPKGGPLDIMASYSHARMASTEEYFVPEAYRAQRLALDMPSHYRLLSDSFGLTAHLDLGFATVSSLTAYQDRTYDRTIYGYYAPETQRSFSQELRLVSPAREGAKIDYVAGLYLEDLRFSYRMPVMTLGNHQTIRTLAAFGELTWHATDRLSITPGLRVSNERTQAQADYASVSYGNRVDATRVLPKLALGYRLDGNTRLYAVASTGFKAGGFTRAAVPTTLAYAYKPQYTRNIEVGLKGNTEDHRVDYSLSAYYIVNTGFQLPVGTVAVQYLENVGTARSRGVDLNLRLRPVDPFTISLSGSLNRSWFSRYDNALTPGLDLTGHKVPYAPSAQLNANIDYRISLPGSLGTLSPHAGVSHNGRIWFTEANAVGQGPYTLVDAGLSWRLNERLGIDLYGDNLTDKTYATYGFDTGGAGLAYQLGRGREFGLRLRAGL
ncbi:TonB-dependent receptor [Novosphingobium terrae]|uniref:TonB-dependent receptor n=1 Tax=Novosphingobium terrae TaxID=2726189 RepID=UPI001980E8E2|nr:TonB-dependent receptor [Novosphingobium terrae]